MSGWSFAWDRPDGAETAARSGWKPLGAYAILLPALLFASWLFAYAAGLFTTLGYAGGSERHGRHADYAADETQIGLSTIYLLRGQRAWWDYEVEVEGHGGVRLTIARAVPGLGHDFRDVRHSGRGRFEVVAPEAGFYSFEQELVPHGVLISGGAPGATRYRLTWGVD